MNVLSNSERARTQPFVVGGVQLEQPFKVRRLGHFGINLYRLTEAVHFYKDLLGFRLVDSRERPPSPEWGNSNGYFFRYQSDHHALVLYSHPFLMSEWQQPRDVTINQITWQVGSLEEVVAGERWFKARGECVVRSGRDMPGSNWATYLLDPEGHRNEIFYGMEQIGWDGRSKPWDMHDRGFTAFPELPQISEYAEVNEAAERGVNLLGGFRDTEALPPKFDVQGILLARPFKIVKHGPVNLFVRDAERELAWYRDVLGFTLTEEVDYQGHRCRYLRNNTEHHSLALFPVELRSQLGLRDDTTLMSFGVQVANYRQLRDAMSFLRAEGIELREVPPELSPGMDHTFLALDPDGHAVQFYWSMEQIGWDGKPRPASQRRKILTGEWPETLPANSDSFAGEPLLGPWG